MINRREAGFLVASVPLAVIGGFLMGAAPSQREEAISTFLKKNFVNLKPKGLTCESCRWFDEVKPGVAEKVGFSEANGMRWGACRVNPPVRDGGQFAVKNFMWCSKFEKRGDDPNEKSVDFVGPK